MFSPDVSSLKQFYASPLGESSGVLLRDNIAGLWPEAKDEVLLCVGYATPYIERYQSQATLAVCMPSGQGAVYWPPSANNHVFMAHDSELPITESSVNRVLLAHALENSEQLSLVMQELWRVLTPGGRVLALVPNRMGMWSRSPRSPFGYGRPFSMTQLRELFTQNDFTITRTSSALFVPPTYLKFVWRIASKFEKVGRLLCPFFGGVLLIEAEKQIHGAISQPAVARGYRVPAATKPAMSRS
ncbi:MAG: class I SAM-dependent methyltransferase [Rickettsiales bacterium]